MEEGWFRRSGICLLCRWVAERKTERGLCQGCVELCRVLLQAVGKGWSQHIVGALALDAECCCVLSPAQRLANTVCLSASTSDLLASPPALPAQRDAALRAPEAGAGFAGAAGDGRNDPV